MKILIGMLIGICIIAWHYDDLLRMTVDSRTLSQYFGNPMFKTASSPLTTKQAKLKAMPTEPQGMSEEKFRELAAADYETALESYKQSYLNALNSKDKDILVSSIVSEEYDPETLRQSLKNIKAKLDESSATSDQTAQTSMSSEHQELSQDAFRKRADKSDVQEAFQEFYQGYQAAERKEFKKVQDFIATGAYE